MNEMPGQLPSDFSGGVAQTENNKTMAMMYGQEPIANTFGVLRANKLKIDANINSANKSVCYYEIRDIVFFFRIHMNGTNHITPG